MSVNPKWARWIFSSLATCLKQVATDNHLPCIVEGLDERTSAYSEASDRVEIHISGPFTREVSRNYYHMEVMVRVLITSRLDGPDLKNRYTFADICGQFHGAMDSTIAVYRYGDDDSLFECLSPANDKHEPVKVFHFGQQGNANGPCQSMVNAKYVMEFFDRDE